MKLVNIDANVLGINNDVYTTDMRKDLYEAANGLNINLKNIASKIDETKAFQVSENISNHLDISLENIIKNTTTQTLNFGTDFGSNIKLDFLFNYCKGTILNSNGYNMWIYLNTQAFSIPLQNLAKHTLTFGFDYRTSPNFFSNGGFYCSGMGGSKALTETKGVWQRAYVTFVVSDNPKWQDFNINFTQDSGKAKPVPNSTIEVRNFRLARDKNDIGMMANTETILEAISITNDIGGTNIIPGQTYWENNLQSGSQYCFQSYYSLPLQKGKSYVLSAKGKIDAKSVSNKKWLTIYVWAEGWSETFSLVIKETDFITKHVRIIPSYTKGYNISVYQMPENRTDDYDYANTGTNTLQWLNLQEGSGGTGYQLNYGEVLSQIAKIAKTNISNIFAINRTATNFMQINTQNKVIGQNVTNLVIENTKLKEQNKILGKQLSNNLLNINNQNKQIALLEQQNKMLGQQLIQLHLNK